MVSKKKLERKSYIIKIYQGDPSPDDFKKIGEMIQEGCAGGEDIPQGIYWTVSIISVETEE